MTVLAADARRARLEASVRPDSHELIVFAPAPRVRGFNVSVRTDERTGRRPAQRVIDRRAGAGRCSAAIRVTTVRGYVQGESGRGCHDPGQQHRGDPGGNESQRAAEHRYSGPHEASRERKMQTGTADRMRLMSRWELQVRNSANFATRHQSQRCEGVKGGSSTCSHVHFCGCVIGGAVPERLVSTWPPSVPPPRSSAALTDVWLARSGRMASTACLRGRM